MGLPDGNGASKEKVVWSSGCLSACLENMYNGCVGN